MKDLVVVWMLANRIAFDGPSLCHAIPTCCRRHKTAHIVETQPSRGLLDGQWPAAAKKKL